MRAGSLQFVIEVLKPDIEKNVYGEDYCTYVHKFGTRANVIYNNGNRTVENDEIIFAYDVTFQIRMYHFFNINEKDRIVFAGKQYRILSIEVQKLAQLINIRTEQINE